MNMYHIIKQIGSKLIVLGLLLALASCAKEKTISDLSFDELNGKAKEFMDKKKVDDAMAYLEEIITRFPDSANIGQYKLQLADLCFESGKYAAAQALYENFNEFYPADQQAEYSKYKSILSTFNQTLRTDCDQTDTDETVKLCQEYIQNDAYNKYRKDIVDIQTTCENKLINKEIYVFKFYVKHGNYDAARNRLKYLKDKYLGKNIAREPELLYLECKLASKEKDTKTLEKNLEKLMTKYPKSDFTDMAQALTARRVFIF